MSKKRRPERKTEPARITTKKPDKRVDIVIACCLVALVAAIYAQTAGFGFINLDDNNYIYDNQAVTAGLTTRGMNWAFTTFSQANWHPLTWVSLMADAQATRWAAAHGLKPGGTPAGIFHLTNLILHAANAVLLYALLAGLTGYRWRSAFVAALFAAHPLHVESVAWVAERKDVLSTLFWLLTMLAYRRYVARPSVGRYTLVAAALALGLMAKSMLVSLPIVLLALDFWPLNRVGAPAGRRVRGLVVEKLPLFGLALASCVITFVAQRAGGSVGTMDHVTFASRLANATVSYGAYALKMLWPAGLGIIYPLRLAIPAWEVALTAAFFVGMTAAAVRAARSQNARWLTVGWLWYVITLLPVIGLVQVGAQAMADRYTYVPLVGLSIIVAWGAPEIARRLLKREGARTAALAGIAVAAIAALSAAADVQTGLWSSSIRLYQHTLAVTQADNPVLQANLATALSEAGRAGEAIAVLRDMIRRRPRHYLAYDRLGCVLVGMGDYTQAEANFRHAAKLSPRNAIARNNIGVALIYQRRVAEAIEQFQMAVQLDPNYDQARRNLTAARRLAEGR